MNFIKNSGVIKIICVLMVFSFAGCETVKVKYVDSDDFPSDRIYRLKTVYLYNGKNVDLTGMDPKFKRSFKGKHNVIVYDYEEKLIELKDISSLKIEVIESNQILTAVIIVGVLAVVFVLAFFIAIGTGGFQMH